MHQATLPYRHGPAMLCAIAKCMEAEVIVYTVMGPGFEDILGCEVIEQNGVYDNKGEDECWTLP